MLRFRLLAGWLAAGLTLTCNFASKYVCICHSFTSSTFLSASFLPCYTSLTLLTSNKQSLLFLACVRFSHVLAGWPRSLLFLVSNVCRLVMFILSSSTLTLLASCSLPCILTANSSFLFVPCSFCLQVFCTFLLSCTCLLELVAILNSVTYDVWIYVVCGDCAMHRCVW